MGVLYDYFRAADDVAARAAAERPGGPLTSDGSGAPFDGVAARDIDPVVSLGQLVAFVRGATWSPELVPADEIARSAAGGAWVERLGQPVRDWLAGAADDTLPEIVVKWSQIEEFAPADDVDETQLLALVADLVELSRRAVAAGQQLYCWCCL
jgi:hypothetical protein